MSASSLKIRRLPHLGHAVSSSDLAFEPLFAFFDQLAAERGSCMIVVSLGNNGPCAELTATENVFNGARVVPVDQWGIGQKQHDGRNGVNHRDLLLLHQVQHKLR